MKYYDKSLGPVISFIIWLTLFAIVCIVGISNVFASTYYLNRQYEQQYYNNNGSYVTSITTSWMESYNSYVSGNIPTTANSYGAGLSITSPIPLLANHVYSMSVYFEDRDNIALSTKNQISVASSLNSAAQDYANNLPGTDMLYSKVSNNSILQFVFKVHNNHTYLFFPWTTTTSTSQDYVLTQIVMEDLGSEGISQNDINNSLNNQTNILNSSIQNSTNTITGEINDMEQSIVDSNKETQEVIKDQFNDCEIYDKTFNTSDININDNFLNSNGIIEASGGWGIIEYIEIHENINYTLKLNRVFGNSPAFCLYDKNKNLINCTKYSNGTEFNFNSNNAKYLSMSFIIVQGTTANLKSNEEICSNKIDETNDKLTEQNETSKGIFGKIKDLFNFLSNDDDVDTSSFGDVAGWLPPGPIDSLINLPLTFFNSLSSDLSNTCIPIDLPLPYVNKTLTLPCMNTFYDSIGINSFMNWTGVIASCFILYSYLMKLYKWVDDTLDLRAKNALDGWGGV